MPPQILVCPVGETGHWSSNIGRAARRTGVGWVIYKNKKSDYKATRGVPARSTYENYTIQDNVSIRRTRVYRRRACEIETIQEKQGAFDGRRTEASDNDYTMTEGGRRCGNGVEYP